MDTKSKNKNGLPPRATPSFLKKFNEETPVDMMDVAHRINGNESDKGVKEEIVSEKVVDKPDTIDKDFKDYTLFDWLDYYKSFTHKNSIHVYISSDMKELLNQMKGFAQFKDYDMKDMLSAIVRTYFEEHKQEFAEYRKTRQECNIWD
ncbi:MAG: hypothetical protein IKW30_09650 [Lachnospiraceae bacterium]|nr:hypothetical protein [Lachnospiraceae bacterium]